MRAVGVPANCVCVLPDDKHLLGFTTKVTFISSTKFARMSFLHMCMTHPSFDKDFHFQNCQNHILDMSCVVCFRILLSLHTVCAGGGGGGASHIVWVGVCHSVRESPMLY